MNGKTAKLLNRYSKAKGLNSRDLKREWYALTSKQRFLRRQEMLQDLKK